MLSRDYIVRIYRDGKHKPRAIVGTVEEVGTEGKKPFANFDELWQIVGRVKDATAPSGVKASVKKGKRIQIKDKDNEGMRR